MAEIDNYFSQLLTKCYNKQKNYCWACNVHLFQHKSYEIAELEKKIPSGFNWPLKNDAKF